MGQGLVIRSLNILLGLFFMFLGSLKITPNIIRDLHKDLRSEYAKYAKVGRLAPAGLTLAQVFPFAKSLGYKVPSKWYRRGVGGTEILCGETPGTRRDTPVTNHLLRPGAAPRS